MAKNLRCSIVTPNEAVFEDDITYASIPSWDGQMGVMLGQSPVLTKLGMGSLRLDLPEGGSRWFLLEGGFAQVQEDHLTLLTENATPADELSASEAQAELAEANARVAQSGEDQARVERDQQRALAKKWLTESGAARG